MDNLSKGLVTKVTKRAFLYQKRQFFHFLYKKNPLTEPRDFLNFPLQYPKDGQSNTLTREQKYMPAGILPIRECRFGKWC